LTASRPTQLAGRCNRFRRFRISTLFSVAGFPLATEKRVFSFTQILTREENSVARPTIAILGASSNRTKFGNRAVRAYAAQGYDVYPINPNADVVEGIKTYRSILDVPVAQLDRISVYVPPSVGLQLLPEIAQKPAREVWFNPGSESDELLERARKLGIPVVAACSIVAVGVNPHALG
jgi:predicted CoA-binding protein